MRFKRNFTLYPRKTKKGVIWYYRTYDNNDSRTSGTSTGLSNKIKAIAFCEQLFKDGKLYSSDIQNHPLSDYIKNFFDDDSRWVKNKKSEGTEENPSLAKNSLIRYRGDFKNHIYPYFENVKVKNLTPSILKDFRNSLLDKELKRSTINGCMNTLSLICTTLIEEGIISTNPVKAIKRLIEDKQKVDAYSINDAILILNSKYWNTDVLKAVSVIACFTGMRINEILAIDKEHCHPDYYDCIYQIDVDGQIKKNKTKQARKIPWCKQVYEFVMKYFVDDNFSFRKLKQKPYKELLNVIEEEKIKDKRPDDVLVFHSWRHFYNTYLLSENIASVKVDAVIGHSTGVGQMQQIYTNWEISHFSEVIAANEKLWIKIFE